MAKQYVVTEEEFLSLIDQLKLAEFERKDKGETPEEMNRGLHWISPLKR